MILLADHRYALTLRLRRPRRPSQAEIALSCRGEELKKRVSRRDRTSFGNGTEIPVLQMQPEPDLGHSDS